MIEYVHEMPKVAHQTEAMRQYLACACLLNDNQPKTEIINSVQIKMHDKCYPYQLICSSPPVLDIQVAMLNTPHSHPPYSIKKCSIPIASPSNHHLFFNLHLLLSALLATSFIKSLKFKMSNFYFLPFLYDKANQNNRCPYAFAFSLAA